MSDTQEALWIGVDGHPRALPRPRGVGGVGKRRFVSIVDPKAKFWAGLVERAVKQALETVPANARGWLSGPVQVDLHFEFPTKTRTRWGKEHVFRPDADNLAKMVLDCMERAGALPAGDAKVSSVKATKRWAARGGCLVNMKPAAGEAGSGAGQARAPEWLS